MSDRSLAARTIVELRLGDASTPERVEAAARMFRAMLHTAYPFLPHGSVTMVVTNFSMGAGLRARTPEGREAMQSVLAFMRSPEKYAVKHPEHSEMAGAIMEFCREVPFAEAPVFVRPGSKKPLAQIDGEYLSAMRRVRELGRQTDGLARGTTAVYSPVLRVGKKEEDGRVRARIKLDGAFHDVRVDCAAEVFFDAAKSGDLAHITLRTAWRRDGQDRLRFDPRHTVAIAIKLVKAVEGDTALAALRAAAPSLQTMSDEEFDEVVRDLESDG